MGMELRPAKITRAHLVRARIGEDYWSCDFSNFLGPEDAKIATKKYLRSLREAKEEGIGLLFGGKPGPGKTTLAVIALKYILRAGWTGYMTSLSEIVEETQKEWDLTFLENCRQNEFLLLDDLGKEHMGPTGYSANVFDNLIRYRTQHRLITFITTNLTRNDIKQRYGGALLSLVEGKTHVIAVNAPDVRMEVLKPGIEKKYS